MRRFKTLVTLTLLAMAILSGAVGNRDQTLAADYSCHTGTCPGVAQCSGDYWSQSGSCAITCYRNAGTPGQIVVNGSASCAPPSTGGGGLIGFYYGDGDAHYCVDNWWWDTRCAGPDDTYNPGKIGG
jgi:hypothetical protein